MLPSNYWPLNITEKVSNFIIKIVSTDGTIMSYIYRGKVGKS